MNKKVSLLLCLIFWLPLKNYETSAFNQYSSINFLGNYLFEYSQSMFIGSFGRFLQLSLAYFVNPDPRLLDMAISEGKTSLHMLSLLLNQTDLKYGVNVQKHKKMMDAPQVVDRFIDNFKEFAACEVGSQKEKESLVKLKKSLNETLENVFAVTIELLDLCKYKSGQEGRFDFSGLAEKLKDLFGFLRNAIPVILEGEFRKPMLKDDTDIVMLKFHAKFDL